MGKDLKGKELGAGYSQRPDGRYEKRFRYKGKQKSVYGSSLKECKSKYNEVQRAIDDGIYSETHAPKLDAYFDEWIKNREALGEIKGSSVFVYRTSYNNHIKKEFGAVRLDKIERADIKKFQREMLSELKPATINRIMALLHSILKTATEDDIISRNPCDNIKNISMGESESETRSTVRALTDEELRLFIKTSEDSYYYNAIRLMFATGMRSGEIRSLQWSDFDSKNNQLHVRTTASIDSDGMETVNTPKTKHSRRTYPVNSQIREILEDQRKRMTEKYCGIIPMNGYIFESVYGKMMSRTVLKAEMDKMSTIIRKTNKEFKSISPHCARHTFITNAILQGQNEFVVKSIVGHAPNSKTTTQVYLDRSEKAMTEAMNTINIAM